jgi:hypothetical protein
LRVALYRVGMRGYAPMMKSWLRFKRLITPAPPGLVPIDVE